MVNPLKVKVDFESETNKALLKFITDTQEGKYTAAKPDLTQVTYKRLQIQEQDTSEIQEEGGDEMLLFGLSY